VQPLRLVGLRAEEGLRAGHPAILAFGTVPIPRFFRGRLSSVSFVVPSGPLPLLPFRPRRAADARGPRGWQPPQSATTRLVRLRRPTPMHFYEFAEAFGGEVRSGWQYMLSCCDG
jgi:hypothetical protein